MHRLATIHNVTDRQTDDRQTQPCANSTTVSTVGYKFYKLQYIVVSNTYTKTKSTLANQGVKCIRGRVSFISKICYLSVLSVNH